MVMISFRLLPAAALLCLLAAVSPARADTIIAPPPTFVADSIYLGFPVGPIVGVALAGAAVTSFLWLRKRGFPRGRAGGICVFAYVVVNFGVYLLAVNGGSVKRTSNSARLRTVNAP